MRPVEVYWNQKRLRGEIPKALSPEARRVLQAAGVDPDFEVTHPALRGLPKGGLSYRIVTDLLREGEMTTPDVMRRYGLARSTAGHLMLFLTRSGRITSVRDASGGSSQRFVYVVADAEAFARGREITEEVAA